MQNDAEPKRVQDRRPGADRDALRDAIAQEECLLAKLEVKQTESRHRLTVLLAELAALDTEVEIRVRLPVSPMATTPRTSADKVRLFRSLFRGREDIFPTRFVSAKTGKSGARGHPGHRGTTRPGNRSLYRRRLRRRATRYALFSAARVVERDIDSVRRPASSAPSREAGSPHLRLRRP